MLIAACSPNWTKRPVAASRTKRLPSCDIRENPRNTMNANSATIDEADDEPELLAGDREHKIGMGIGQHVLDRAFAGPAAPQPAIGESFDRAVDLIAVAGRGIEKLVDPAPDMRQVHIGAGQTPEPGKSARHHPIKPQPGHEELGEPDRRDDRRHADVGLLDQHRDDREKQRRADQVSGKARAQPLLREQPGGDHRKGRLDEFRGLQRQAGQIDPAPRALDLGADDKSQRKQRERDRQSRSIAMRRMVRGGCSETTNMMPTASGSIARWRRTKCSSS